MPPNFVPPTVLWPALREKNLYWAVGRAAYLNGDGPKFLFGSPSDESLDLYNKFALGQGQSSPLDPRNKAEIEERLESLEPGLLYAPPDRMGAPVVLFRDDDALLDQPDIPDGGTAPPVVPDKLDTVVIRTYADGSSPDKPPRRVVAPPHISYEHAEQQGTIRRS